MYDSVTVCRPWSYDVLCAKSKPHSGLMLVLLLICLSLTGVVLWCLYWFDSVLLVFLVACWSIAGALKGQLVCFVSQFWCPMLFVFLAPPLYSSCMHMFENYFFPASAQNTSMSSKKGKLLILYQVDLSLFWAHPVGFLPCKWDLKRSFGVTRLMVPLSFYFHRNATVISIPHFSSPLKDQVSIADISVVCWMFYILVYLVYYFLGYFFHLNIDI